MRGGSTPPVSVTADSKGLTDGVSVTADAKGLSEGGADGLGRGLC